MEFFCIAGGQFGSLFPPQSCPYSFWRLLLLVIAQILLVSGQSQVGVSLRFRGAAIPNDSFVDIDDIMYTVPSGQLSDLPSNTNPRDEAVLCVTDLVDCCDAPRTVRGNWYLPDGTRFGLDTGSYAAFQANRGPNEVIDGQRFYGSVRLYRRYNPPQGRGRFRCELPSAADSSVNQILYVNILNFGFHFNVDHVIISPSTGSTATTAGQTDYSLNCSSTLFDPSSLTPQSGIPPPNFQWSFDGSTSLPSGVIAMPTVMSSSNSTSETYTSTLQFNSPLSQCHIGNYRCRLGPGRLENSVMITMNGLSPINVSVEITTSGAKVLGQSGYSLICGVTVTGTANPSITYQWTKNNGTQTQIGTDRVLSFSPLRLSDAGQYTCHTVTSPCSITKMDTQDVTLQIPAPIVTLSSSIPSPIPPFSGSDVILTCAVELSPAVDVPVTVNTALFNPEGSMTSRTAQLVMGSITNYTSTFTISSFGRSNSGQYICRATVSLPSNAYISGSSLIHSVRVITGVYLALRGTHITNNSNIDIKNIGQSSDSPNGALQCITDNLRCCNQNPGRGEWYQPNGAL